MAVSRPLCCKDSHKSYDSVASWAAVSCRNRACKGESEDAKKLRFQYFGDFRKSLCDFARMRKMNLLFMELGQLIKQGHVSNGHELLVLGFFHAL